MSCWPKRSSLQRLVPALSVGYRFGRSKACHSSNRSCLTRSISCPFFVPTNGALDVDLEGQGLLRCESPHQLGDSLSVIFSGLRWMWAVATGLSATQLDRRSRGAVVRQRCDRRLLAFADQALEGGALIPTRSSTSYFAFRRKCSYHIDPMR